MRWWCNEKPSVNSMWLLELTAVTMKGCRGHAPEHMNCVSHFWDIWTLNSVFANFRALPMAHDCSRYCFLEEFVSANIPPDSLVAISCCSLY